MDYVRRLMLAAFTGFFLFGVGVGMMLVSQNAPEPKRFTIAMFLLFVGSVLAVLGGTVSFVYAHQAKSG